MKPSDHPNQTELSLPAATGTYLLWLHLRHTAAIRVGRLGRITFRRGWYGYVGSAFGPGGLAARLGRHLRTDKKLRWHIDYLACHARFVGALIFEAPGELECRVAAMLARSCARPVDGFGASDWSGYGYWFPEYFADLDQLLDRLCADAPARLVGHSMGGNIALIYSGIRPERVRRVVSLEGFGLPRSRPAEAPDRLRDWLQQLRAPPSFGEYQDDHELARRLQRGNPRLEPEIAMFIARAWARPSPGGAAAISRWPSSSCPGSST